MLYLVRFTYLIGGKTVVRLVSRSEFIDLVTAEMQRYVVIHRIWL